MPSASPLNAEYVGIVPLVCTETDVVAVHYHVRSDDLLEEMEE